MKHIAAGEMKMLGVDVDNNDGRLSSCKRKHKRACQTMISVRLKNLAQHKVMVVLLLIPPRAWLLHRLAVRCVSLRTAVWLDHVLLL